jgi:phosphotransferase system HPr (HPr) family protein
MKDITPEQMPTLDPQKVDEYWTQDVLVMNKNGLHARPSAHFYEKILMPYGNEIDLSFILNVDDTREIKSVFDLMSLGLESGTRFTIKIKYTGDASDFDDDVTPEKFILSKIHNMFLNIFTD